MSSFGDRLQHAWNAFLNKDPTPFNTGPAYSMRPDRIRFTRGNERSIVTAVYNRIAMDCAAIKIEHIRLDENDRFVEVINDGLNYCLTTEANIDQTGRAFIQDAVMSLLDEGCVALVPVETDINPAVSSSFDILQMRTGKIVEWMPTTVKVSIYNDKSGNKEEIVLPKASISIVENPLFAVMNEPNSTMQRLVRKLALLDRVDEQNGAGKLDLIIQLPYVIKTEARRQQADNRRKDIEMQLSSSQYGIAYTDGTEHITQLNRSVENQLLPQIESLTRMLYSQLGLTEEIMNGTADEKALNNYYNRTIEPILSALVDEMRRKFLTKTARTQRQSVTFFRDPFKLVPTTDLAELADKFTRNEIMTSNEFRQIIGMKPAADPNADELRNKNMPIQDEGNPVDIEDQNGGISDQESYNSQMNALDNLDSQLNDLSSQLSQSDKSLALMHYASKYYDPVKAHEYYEEYVKEGKLKGRESSSSSEYSTSKLNDQGKMAYKQIKESLADEKTSKINASKESMNSQIEANKSNLESQIAANKEQMTSQIEKAKEDMQSDLNTHVNTTQTQIDQINQSIKSLKKKGSGNAGRITSLQKQIADLKTKNSEKREALNEVYQNTSAQLREDNSNQSTQLREANSETTTGLRSQHKATSEAAREDYNTKVKDELKKLIDSGEFKKTSSKSSSKSSSSSGKKITYNSSKK